MHKLLLHYSLHIYHYRMQGYVAFRTVSLYLQLQNERTETVKTEYINTLSHCQKTLTSKAIYIVSWSRLQNTSFAIPFPHLAHPYNRENDIPEFLHVFLHRISLIYSMIVPLYFPIIVSLHFANFRMYLCY